MSKKGQHLNLLNPLNIKVLDDNPLCSITLVYTIFKQSNPITMTKFQFLIVTYFEDGNVSTRQLVNIRRKRFDSAENYIKTKYKGCDGFFVELNNSWSI